MSLRLQGIKTCETKNELELEVRNAREQSDKAIVSNDNALIVQTGKRLEAATKRADHHKLICDICKPIK
jgi:hypothetical protein